MTAADDAMTYRHVWQITDEHLDYTLGDLRDMVAGELPDLLFDELVYAVGQDRWRIVQHVAAWWLVVDVPVMPWVDPVRDDSRRATTPPTAVAS